MTKTRLAVLSGIAGFWLALVPAAWAHHSQSEYDLRSKVEVEGTVTKVEWRSPHAWIYVDVSDANGEKVKLELRAAEPGDFDAPGMDAGFAETRGPNQSVGRASPQLPGHRDRQLHQGQ